MARRRKYKRRNTRGRFALIYRLMIFIVICGAVAAALAMFFKVDNVEVSGNSRYSEEEIVAASGVTIGENLFFLNKYDAAARITQSLSYAESAEISRRLPSTLCVRISECDRALAVKQEGNLWLICYNGKIADTVPVNDKGSYALVTGITLQDPVVGQTMVVPEELQSKYDTMLELLQKLHEKDMLSDLQELHFEEDAQITLHYLDRFDVQLRWTADFDYKLEYLKAVVERLEDNEKGIIDLTQEGKASFIPQ